MTLVKPMAPTVLSKLIIIALPSVDPTTFKKKLHASTEKISAFGETKDCFIFTNRVILALRGFFRGALAGKSSQGSSRGESYPKESG